MRSGRLMLVIGGAAFLCGCGSGKSTTSITTTQTVLPEYDACMSVTPIDAGNPNEPVITLLGPRVVKQTIGSPYKDAGATAQDPKDGDITSKIVVTGASSVDTSTVGDYLVRFNVTDSAQLAARETVRIVRVTDGKFSRQTAHDIGTTAAHMGYYEHLPVNYSDDPAQTFPLIIFIHGWGRARFLDPYRVQAPLSDVGNVNLAGLTANSSTWDDSRPLIVLSPQKCVDELTFVDTARRMKLFIDYAINTYKVDTTRIYMGGHSQGSGDTWDYVTNYPRQLAAIFPIAGGYGTVSGCALKDTPAWAFAGEFDSGVNMDQVATVASINACNPPETAKVTILPGTDHDTSETEVLTLSGLGQGMSPYDKYDQSIYDWMLNHHR